MPITKTCEVCGAGFKVPPVRAHSARACSNQCGNVLRGKSNQKRVVLECLHCRKPFGTPVCNADRRIYCSYECKHNAAVYKAKLSEKTSGENNAMWRGGQSTHTAGYRLVRCPEHPYSTGGYVFEHRLIVEQALRKQAPGHAFLDKLGDQLYLKRGIDVHHKDSDKTNNDLNNLVACTPGAHRLIHNGAVPREGTYWPANALPQ